MPGNEPIVELKGATVLESAGGRVVLKHLEFLVRPGELVLIRADVDEETELLFDVLQGIVPVDSGSAAFLGRDWSRMRSGRACAQRAKTGRVFESGGWLHDLNVFDNIMLRSQHHHMLSSRRKLYVEALGYARAVGLKDISRARPEQLPKRELRMHQWVRACMGEPELILLERPELDVPPGDVNRLMDLMESCRNRGAGVVWITSSPAVAAHKKLLSVRKAVMKNGRVEVR